jgi:large subunit ribosomal protein L15
MKLHFLPKTSSRAKRTKRLGCGRGSGHGKTSSRGHKGGNSRSGYSTPSNYSGIPYYRRLPKRGFNNYNFRREFVEINLSDIEAHFTGEDGVVVDNETLHAKGLLKRRRDEVKILGNGTVSRPLTVNVARCSKSAREKIESAGGKFVSGEGNVS